MLRRGQITLPLTLVASMTLASCGHATGPTKLSAPLDCQKMSGVKIESLIVQKIQKVAGTSIVESRIPLEGHYYPQMDRPQAIIVTSKNEILSLNFLGSDRESYEVKAQQSKPGEYRLSLPKFEKFKGKMILNFKNNLHCQSEIVFEELSP